MCYCSPEIRTPYCSSFKCQEELKRINRKEKNSKLEEVEFDISDDVFLILAKMAHTKDITFNKLCNNILEEYLEKLDESN